MVCPECKEHIPGGSKVCPECGYPIKEQRMGFWGGIWIMFCLVGMVVGFGGCIASEFYY